MTGFYPEERKGGRKGEVSVYNNSMYCNHKLCSLNVSLTTNFTHKKMFKKITNYYPEKLKGATNQQGLADFYDLSREYTNQQQKQKKRKAKKHRLETRRQKKRTRLYPRPIWLRYRMFLNLIKHRIKLPSFTVTRGTKDKTNKIRNSSSFVRLKNIQSPNVGFSEEMTIDKKTITEDTNLTKYKNQATYVNFSQNTNNPQNLPNNQEKNTLLRDFWISSYNNTSSLFASANPLGNILQKNLWWFLPINTTFVNSQSYESNMVDKQRKITIPNVKKSFNLLKDFSSIYSTSNFFQELKREVRNRPGYRTDDQIKTFELILEPFP